MICQLQWIQEWYKENCFYEWHFHYGLKISTLCNPGWAISIDLTQTPLADESFEKVVVDRDEHDWVHCSVANNVFEGRGGPGNLEEMLTIFQKWAIENDALEIVKKERAEALEEEAKEEPSKWVLTKKFSRHGLVEYNRITHTDVAPPYIHEKTTPGWVRPAEEWEIPKTLPKNSSEALP